MKWEKNETVDKLMSGWEELDVWSSKSPAHGSCHGLFNVAGCLWLWEILTLGQYICHTKWKSTKSNSRLDYLFHEKLFLAKVNLFTFTNLST